MPTAEPVMTVREMAAELRLDVTTVRDRIKSGEIPAIKAGKGRTSPYRVTRRAFAEYVAQLAVEASA